MTLFKAATVMCWIPLRITLLAPSARPDESNRKTVVTFSVPVEIPGVHLVGWGVLPADTYVFNTLDSQANRHIAQVFSKDETTTP